MRAEYINPFIDSLVNAFDTMLSCPVKRGQPQLLKNGDTLYDVSGVIGLSGRAVGSTVVSFSEAVALKTASTMLMMEITELDADATDAVGEIANMVAGAAKAKLEEYDLSIGLPNVIVGHNHTVWFPSDVTPLCVPFETDWGPLKLVVGLTDDPKEVNKHNGNAQTAAAN